MDGVVTHFGAPYCIRTEVLYGRIHTYGYSSLYSVVLICTSHSGLKGIICRLDIRTPQEMAAIHVILIQGYKQMRITSFTNFYSDTSSVMACQICSEI